MTDSTRQSMGPIRWVTGAVTVGGLVLCYWLRELGLRDAAVPVFFLITAICGAFTLFVHGLGARRGMALGVMTGFLAALGLTLSFSSPIGNLAGFVVLATGVVGFLGHLAGGWGAPGSPSALQLAGDRSIRGLGAGGPAQDAPAPVTGAPGAVDRRADGSPRSGSPEAILGAVVADFTEWTESEAGRACCSDAADWSAFDQFTRVTLRERLGAAGVRVFRVSTDGERLEPLTRHGGPPDQWLSTRAGLVGHVVATGRVYVADTPEQGLLLKELAATGSTAAFVADPGNAGTARVADGSLLIQPGRWTWLLPLRIGKRTCALVAVRRIGQPAAGGAVLAEALRNQLQLFWTHICGLQTLSRFMRTDRQSGMLERAELLSQLQDIISNSGREDEPVMLLAIGIEGLRGLDDAGRWSQRDALVQRLGHVLRVKVRSDDLLGRFCDDRFVVVLRRLDSALGTLVAEKLIDSVRAVLDMTQQQMAGLAAVGDGARCVLQLRAGLAGTGLSAGTRAARGHPVLDIARRGERGRLAHDPGLLDGQTLLERALGLLDYAREQCIDIATDLMSGLPAELARPGATPATPQRPLAATRSTEHVASDGGASGGQHEG